MSQRYRNWCFTAFTNPYYADWSNASVRYAVYQHELCPQTGQDHWQGYAEFTKPLSMDNVKKILNDRTVHLEARRGTRDQARRYCMKEDTRFPGDEPVEHGEWTGQRERARTDLIEAKKKIEAAPSWQCVLHDEEIANVVARHRAWAREIYENRPQVFTPPKLDLYQWQVEASEHLEGAVEKRKILWIWSSESGTGKSTFFDFCSSRWNILPGTDYVNTLYAYDNHHVIWFDLSRAQSHEHIPYHALEKLSNGGFHMSSKYVSCRKFIACHIVVTSNIAPDETKLPDRCIIIYANKLRPAVSPLNLSNSEPSLDLGDAEDL